MAEKTIVTLLHDMTHPDAAEKSDAEINELIDSGYRMAADQWIFSSDDGRFKQRKVIMLKQGNAIPQFDKAMESIQVIRELLKVINQIHEVGDNLDL